MVNFLNNVSSGDDSMPLNICYMCIHILYIDIFIHMCVRAKSLQLCPTLCYPMDSSPPGSSVHEILDPGKNTGVGCHALVQGICLTQESKPMPPAAPAQQADSLLPRQRGSLYLWASLGVLVVKNSPPNAGDPKDADWILGLGRYPGGGRGNPFQYSPLENPMDRGVVWRVTKS